MKLLTAREIASKLLEILKECCCDRADVVGSVWRGDKFSVKDIDIVCLPKDQRARETIRTLGHVKEEKSTHVAICLPEPEPSHEIRTDRCEHADVWIVENPEAYDLALWHRRMRADQFIRLASMARQKGMKLSWKEGLIGMDGRVITRDPKEIERMLGGDTSV